MSTIVAGHGQSFAEFLRFTKPDYQLSWFHEELAGELDQFLDDVLEKRSPRTIMQAFSGRPQHLAEIRLQNGWPKKFCRTTQKNFEATQKI